MSKKLIYNLIIPLLMVIMPAWAQGQAGPNDIIRKMQTDLDLSQEQVYNISPVIEKYSIAFADLQQSIDDGTINQSAISSQKQGLEAAETQELSPYLKPYQLSEWRSMQSQMDEDMDQDNSDGNADADEYTNLPRSSGGK